MRLNTGGKPRGVRKFFPVECVHPVPEQHEHVFTGSSVAMWPAWSVYAGNKQKYLSSPCSTCRSISGFLTGIFGRWGGRNCTHQTEQSNRVPEKSHSTLFCCVSLVMCYSWELFSAEKRLAWRPKSLSTTPIVLMGGGGAGGGGRIHLFIWAQLLVAARMLPLSLHTWNIPSSALYASSLCFVKREKAEVMFIRSKGSTGIF